MQFKDIRVGSCRLHIALCIEAQLLALSGISENGVALTPHLSFLSALLGSLLPRWILLSSLCPTFCLTASFLCALLHRILPTLHLSDLRSCLNFHSVPPFPRAVFPTLNPSHCLITFPSGVGEAFVFAA